jgi:hypothetical protein
MESLPVDGEDRHLRATKESWIVERADFKTTAGKPGHRVLHAGRIRRRIPAFFCFASGLVFRRPIRRRPKKKGPQLALEPLNGQGIAGYVPKP